MPRVALVKNVLRLSLFLEYNFDLSRVLSTGGGGGGGEKLPPQKFYSKKNLQLFQIKIFFDDDFKESTKGYQCPEMRFQPILNTIFSNFSGGACPRTALEGPQKNFLAAAWLKNFF